jgi:hypothetical protein
MSKEIPIAVTDQIVRQQEQIEIWKQMATELADAGRGMKSLWDRFGKPVATLSGKKASPEKMDEALIKFEKMAGRIAALSNRLLDRTCAVLFFS